MTYLLDLDKERLRLELNMIKSNFAVNFKVCLYNRHLFTNKLHLIQTEALHNLLQFLFLVQKLPQIYQEYHGKRQLVVGVSPSSPRCLVSDS